MEVNLLSKSNERDKLEEKREKHRVLFNQAMERGDEKEARNVFQELLNIENKWKKVNEEWFSACIHKFRIIVK